MQVALTRAMQTRESRWASTARMTEVPRPGTSTTSQRRLRTQRQRHRSVLLRTLFRRLTTLLAESDELSSDTSCLSLQTFSCCLTACLYALYFTQRLLC